MVGVFCIFILVEILMVVGVIVVGVCGVSEELIFDVERVFLRNFCFLIKLSYGYVIIDICFYFYFFDLLIGEIICDGKKKMYEEFVKVKLIYVMYLLNILKGEFVYKFWKDEMIRLKEEVEKFLGVIIIEEDIRIVIKDKNEEREFLKEFYVFGKL